MKLARPFIFGILLASAFFYFTTYRSEHLHPPSWISRPQHVEITEAAGGEGFDQAPPARAGTLVIRAPSALSRSSMRS